MITHISCMSRPTIGELATSQDGKQCGIISRIIGKPSLVYCVPSYFGGKRKTLWRYCVEIANIKPQ